jgi:hypothetical protein
VSAVSWRRTNIPTPSIRARAWHIIQRAGDIQRAVSAKKRLLDDLVAQERSIADRLAATPHWPRWTLCGASSPMPD